MPRVGHADSVTNDEHGSRSNIFDWSSSNPVARVIKVTLPTPALSLYKSFIHPYTHSFHTPAPPGRFYLNCPGARGLRHRICG